MPLLSEKVPMLCECLGMNCPFHLFLGEGLGMSLGYVSVIFVGAFLDYFRGFGINYGIFAVVFYLFP